MNNIENEKLDTKIQTTQRILNVIEDFANEQQWSPNIYIELQNRIEQL